MTGLMLSGGGARGAYQAGCLQAISEINKSKQNPFKVVSGISAGSINGAFVASHADDFYKGSHQLVEFWSQLKTENVIKTNSFSVAKNAFKWIFDLGFGKMRKGNKIKFLMDSAPLKNLLQDIVPLERISQNIKNGYLESLAITATDYSTNRNITFVETGNEKLVHWKRVNRESLFTDITIDHIMASSALPFLFPPIRVDKAYYGDGALRNTAPLSSAIHLGAKKLIIIGVKTTEQHDHFVHTLPTPARLLSCLINSALLDGIDIDLERLDRLNRLITSDCTFDNHEFSVVDYLYLCPSKDISEIAEEYFYLLPGNFRYLINGLGSMDESAELISYLLFEGKYCEKLCQLGYQDTLNRSEEILALI